MSFKHWLTDVNQTLFGAPSKGNNNQWYWDCSFASKHGIGIETERQEELRKGKGYKGVKSKKKGRSKKPIKTVGIRE
jgi:hypothetical protein